MPTYQYACTDCGHAFEQFQSFSDDALTVCPECSGKLRKLFNAVGVVFKGSGFYRTDSRGKSEHQRGVGREVGSPRSRARSPASVRPSTPPTRRRASASSSRPPPAASRRATGPRVPSP